MIYGVGGYVISGVLSWKNAEEVCVKAPRCKQSRN